MSWLDDLWQLPGVVSQNWQQRAELAKTAPDYATTLDAAPGLYHNIGAMLFDGKMPSSVWDLAGKDAAILPYVPQNQNQPLVLGTPAENVNDLGRNIFPNVDTGPAATSYYVPRLTGGGTMVAQNQGRTPIPHEFSHVQQWANPSQDLSAQSRSFWDRLSPRIRNEMTQQWGQTGAYGQTPPADNMKWEAVAELAASSPYSMGDRMRFPTESPQAGFRRAQGLRQAAILQYPALSEHWNNTQASIPPEMWGNW